MSAVRIHQPPAQPVVVRQKQRRVFLRLRAAIQMPIQQRQNSRRLLEQLAALHFLLAHRAGSRTRQRHRSFRHQLLAGKPVRAHRRVQRRHQQRRGNSLAADVSQRDAQPGVSEQQKIVVVATDRARRQANPVQLQHGQRNSPMRKQVRLHLLRDVQFVLQPLLFALPGQQPLQRRRHAVERPAQRPQLVAPLHLDPVVEIAAIDRQRRLVQIVDRLRDRPVQPHRRQKRQQLQHSERNRNPDQHLANHVAHIQRSDEQPPVEQRWPRRHIGINVRSGPSPSPSSPAAREIPPACRKNAAAAGSVPATIARLRACVMSSPLICTWPGSFGRAVLISNPPFCGGCGALGSSPKLTPG